MVFIVLSLCDCFNNQLIVQNIQKAIIVFVYFIDGEKELLTFAFMHFAQMQI